MKPCVLLEKPVRSKSLLLPKGDELPIKVTTTGGSGPVRVWGHVKSDYSAEVILKTSVFSES